MWDPCEFFVRSRGKTVLTTWNFLKSKNITFCFPNSYLIGQSQNISQRLRQVRQSGILTRQSKTKHFKIFWAPEKMLLLMKRTKEMQHGACTMCLQSVVRSWLIYIKRVGYDCPFLLCALFALSHELSCLSESVVSLFFSVLGRIDHLNPRIHNSSLILILIVVIIIIVISWYILNYWQGGPKSWQFT